MHTTFPMLLLLLMMVVGLCRGQEETDTSRCSPNGGESLVIENRRFSETINMPAPCTLMNRKT